MFNPTMTVTEGPVWKDLRTKGSAAQSYSAAQAASEVTAG
jgi:hypothetical protein